MIRKNQKSDQHGERDESEFHGKLGLWGGKLTGLNKDDIGLFGNWIANLSCDSLSISAHPKNRFTPYRHSRQSLSLPARCRFDRAAFDEFPVDERLAVVFFAFCHMINPLQYWARKAAWCRVPP
jgi:hypothetical protein